MSVTIKSEHEIELMREAGRILSIVHDEMAKIIRPGVTTMAINRKGEEVIRSYGCIPSFLNYNGFPASICVSVNEEVVHGIPDKKRVLKEGDIVSLDMVNTLIQYSVNMFATGNESHMQEVVSLEDKVDDKEKELQKTHVQRLAKGECSPEVGMIFSDIVSGLERVADHATNIAFAIINAEKEAETAEE